MENPVDNIVDLGLVNYVKHPTNPNYIVYRFPDKGRADSFQFELEQKNIWFERGEEEKRQRTYHLIGIHKNDYKHTVLLNYLVEAKHKKPLIPFKALRYGLIMLSGFLLTIAIIGHCKRQNALASHEDPAVSINNSTNQ
ncbi:MAG: hypothetical protein QNL61_03465 [Crocinitomicaceae bacterium]|jgi:hypothetical protein